MKNFNSLAELLEKQSQLFPNALFITYQGINYTYSETQKKVSTISQFLYQQGIKENAIVSILLPNCPEFIFCWFALNKIGAIINPINPLIKSGEIEYILRQTDSKFCIVNSVTFPKIQERKFKQKIITPIDWENSQNTLKNFRFRLAKATDVAAILYTSGTTSKPKGVMLTNKTFVLGGQAHVFRLNLSQDDKIYAYLPLFSIGGQVYSIAGTVVAGASIVIGEGFSLTSFWEKIIRERITIFNVVGIISQLLVKETKLRNKKGLKLRAVYGTEIPADVAIKFEKKFNVPLLQSYSLTESMLGTANRIEDNKPGSIGKPARHPNLKNMIDIKIVDDQGKSVAVGEVGEIIIKSPVTMKGYFKNQPATKKVLRNGWFFTGDIGKKDQAGYIYFIDRKKDIIRRRGINISAKEIEAVIFQIPEILEVAVIPIPGAFGDNNIKAYIVPKKGRRVDTYSVRKFCQKQLAKFKVPDLLETTDILPKTPTNRVEKSKLKEAFKIGMSSKNINMIYSKNKVNSIATLIEKKELYKQKKEGLTSKEYKIINYAFHLEEFVPALERSVLAVCNDANITLDYINRVYLCTDDHKTSVRILSELGIKERRIDIAKDNDKDYFEDKQGLDYLAQSIGHMASSKFTYGLVIFASYKKVVTFLIGND